MIRPLAQRFVLAASLLLVGLLPACGQEKNEKAAPAPLGEEERKKLVQALFDSQDGATLEANIARAQERGISPQAILEARFLFLVDAQDFPGVAALAPKLAEQKKTFRIEDSEIFNVPEEFFAIVEYSHALQALAKDDEEAFKKHITEAFWLSPRQAQAFGPHIETLRLKQAMAKVKIDLQQQFRRQLDQKKVTLAALAPNSSHFLLHFWSPWSTECEANLPDFLAMTQELTKNDIAVISVLIESDLESLTKANEFRAGIKEENNGAWIVDNSKPALNRTLRVLDLPTVALISPDGAVQYNGHPSDQDLWDALQKLSPKIQRPRLEPVE